jgi:hypothetical protein
MKLQLLSDLHLESHPRFHAEPIPGADLLVLAGDIGSYQEGSRLADTDFGLGRFSPRNGWPVPVVYVPGNHEYDNADFDETHDRLRTLCTELDIQWLERETLVIDGIRFVGTTLWADFDALVEPTDGLAEALKKRGKAMRAADFYLEKAATGVTASSSSPARCASRRWCARRGCASAGRALRRHHRRHHAFRADAGERRSALRPDAGHRRLLQFPRRTAAHAQLWLHGHLHCAFDYVKDGCRVVANPLGYKRNGEQEGYRPDLLIDVR